MEPRTSAWSRRARLTGVGVLAAGVLVAATACGGGTPKAAPPITVPPQSAEPSTVTGALPPDRTTASTAACAKVPRKAGWAAAENAKPGDARWKASLDPDRAVVGYLSQVSAACGDTVALHLSGTTGSASVTAYRIGFYGGKGGRAVWESKKVKVSSQSIHTAAAPTYTVEASWPTALQIPIDASWTPGFYLLVLRPGDNPGDKGSAVPFVVRDDSNGNGAPGSGSSPLLFQASVLTYQAYNSYGKYSLYAGPTNQYADRSRIVSFDRPYAGTGYETPFRYDIPLVTEIEKQGLDADYTTDIDVDQRPSVVPAHKALIIGGHSEYWTRRMYDAAEYARDHGTNLAFLGANTVYWHARLEPSPTGPDRREVVYKTDPDPLTGADPASTTVQWRQAPLNRPESALVGSDFGSLDIVGGAFRVLQPDSWILAGTGLAAGQVVKDSLGGEFDMVTPGRGGTPQNIDVIAAAPIVFFKSPSMATMSYYSAPSGAGVFSGGTTFWACQIDDTCANKPVVPATSAVFATMTDNILRAFAAGPAGKTHPSQQRLAPSAQGLIDSAASPADVGVRDK